MRPRVRSRTAFRIGTPKHTCQRPIGWRHAGAHKTARTPWAGTSTIITTNRPFAEWHEVFPNAACTVSLIDRLVHHSEVIGLEGKSYRYKEAQERAEARARKRRGGKS